MSELRECPFCGCDDEDEVRVEHYRADVLPYRVQCGNCFAHGPACETEKEAISAWNTHADDWQDIETAPKDGTLILGAWSYLYPHDTHPTTGMDLIEVGPDGSIESSEGKCVKGLYTHWKPLPKPPEDK